MLGVPWEWGSIGQSCSISGVPVLSCYIRFLPGEFLCVQLLSKVGGCQRGPRSETQSRSIHEIAPPHPQQKNPGRAPGSHKSRTKFLGLRGSTRGVRLGPCGKPASEPKRVLLSVLGPLYHVVACCCVSAMKISSVLFRDRPYAARASVVFVFVLSQNKWTCSLVVLPVCTQRARIAMLRGFVCDLLWTEGCADGKDV